MESKQSKELIASIKTQIESEGFNADTMVPKLQELREIAKEENDPMLVRVIRQTYEYIQEIGTFNLTFLEDAGKEENFSYFLDLISESQNEYNREELKELGDFLKQQA